MSFRSTLNTSLSKFWHWLPLGSDVQYWLSWLFNLVLKIPWPYKKGKIELVNESDVGSVTPFPTRILS